MTSSPALRPSRASLPAWPGTAGTGALSAANATRIAHSFHVLADSARVRILSLAAAEPGGISVKALVAELGLHQPTVSHHLKVLADAGFLTRERRGTWSLYSPVPERLAELAELVASGPARLGEGAQA